VLRAIATEASAERSGEDEHAVVVAVAVVLMVQVVADEVVEVIAVRDRLVPAAGAVDVAGVVAGAGVAAGAGVRVLGVHRDDVVVHVPAVGVVQVAVVEEVEVALVHDRLVPAAGPVHVLVVTRVHVVLGGGHRPTVRAAAAGAKAPQMRLTRTRCRLTGRRDGAP
jgi:hypothetical protein